MDNRQHMVIDQGSYGHRPTKKSTASSVPNVTRWCLPCISAPCFVVWSIYSWGFLDIWLFDNEPPRTFWPICTRQRFGLHHMWKRDIPWLCSPPIQQLGCSLTTFISNGLSRLRYQIWQHKTIQQLYSQLHANRPSWCGPWGCRLATCCR